MYGFKHDMDFSFRRLFVIPTGWGMMQSRLHGSMVILMAEVKYVYGPKIVKLTFLALTYLVYTMQCM